MRWTQPAGTDIAAAARTIPRARSLRRKAGVRISTAPSSPSLALSPKLSSAAPPNRASRATIAFLESDRPDAPRAGDAYGDIPSVTTSSRTCTMQRPAPERLNRRCVGIARILHALVCAPQSAICAPPTAARMPAGSTFAGLTLASR
jgi:hypothetical protein